MSRTVLRRTNAILENMQLSKEALVRTAAAELNLEKYMVNVSKKGKKENRLKEWEEKVLYGQFVRQTECHN